ncbi:hypothetical protein CDD83_10882 [Cordyceps sp. RAO-2017]|nr:hypothetical protein CDD83_10882 [Cordyceps sp. RAO-2017]
MSDEDVDQGPGQGQHATDQAGPVTSLVPEERAAKRLKVDIPADSEETGTVEKRIPTDQSLTGPAKEADEAKKPDGANGADHRRSGVAPIKKEYLIDVSGLRAAASDAADDDEAEGRGARNDGEPRRGDDRDGGGRAKGKRDKKDKKKKGQNTERSFGKFEDAIRLCNSVAFSSEFSPRPCKFGDRCRLCHDLRKYLADGRREDVDTFGGKCPPYESYGSCPSGWKCRFVKSHMEEVEREDGRKELVLLGGPVEQDKPDGQGAEEKGEGGENGKQEGGGGDELEERRPGVVNVVSMSNKILLNRKRLDFGKADEYIKWMDDEAKISHDFHHRRKEQSPEGIEDLRARFVDPPFKPSEKRRLYFGPETPTLAPLTTQGNLPFRRLCVELGCQLTYSEMAMSMPLLQGSKADWTLMKAHETETSPPRFRPGGNLVFDDYDNGRDLKFGAQISGNQPWTVTKAADALGRFCPHLRLIDLNCGCPIDMVFKSGGGSALLEAQSKMERMVRGMNAV